MLPLRINMNQPEERVLVQTRVPKPVYLWLMEKSAYEGTSVAGVVRRVLMDLQRQPVTKPPRKAKRA